MRGNDGDGLLVAVLHHDAHLFVDLTSNGIGDVASRHQITAQEYLLVTTLKRNRAEIAHAEPRDHLASH